LASDLYEKAVNNDINIVKDMLWGFIGTRSDKLSIHWKRELSDKSYANAQYSLGYAYYNGEGVEIDQNKAIELYKASAAQHHKSAISRLKELGITI
jgi:TPR repeat protein